MTTNLVIKQSKTTVLPLLLLASTTILNNCAANISIEQVTADVTYLAGNELHGRANFSSGIEQAADYINQRFVDIGLKPLNNLQGFKQTFHINSIKTKALNVKLNGKKIEATNLAMASTSGKISWKEIADFSTHLVTAEDDMRSKLRQLNMEGGNHLVLLNNAHSDMFARYQSYFQRGLTKLNLNEKGAIIIVLTDETTINEIDIEATTSIENKPLTNMVGLIPGKTKPDEIVLFSAHYDHLGSKSSGEGDLIFNGADDDASGTSAVINLADYFVKKGNNARTLMFVAFAAEEIGGFGSRYFSEQLVPDQVIAMINIEMVGKPSKFGAGKIWMTGMERSNLGELLNIGLKPQNKEIFQDPYPEQGLFYRSDNATLASLGVPAHSFSSTQLDKDQHYHKVTDDINSIDLNSLHKAIEIISIATQGLVKGTDTPTRIDVEKVKATGKIF